MGSESSALKSYALKEPPFTLPSGLAVYPAVLQDGRCASVFVYKRENEDKVNKAAKHLKTLRHPCLLRFLSCTVEAAGIHLVTERVQPLEVALETLSSAEVCAGIYDILLALIFLHDRGHLTHNNVCLSSVFVSEDGHWKLGGMETVCKVPQATPEFLRSIQSVRDPASIPPEEMSPEFTTLPESHGHARDAFAFGTLVESLLTILSEQVSADVLSSFQQTLHSTLLNPIPKCRPALCTLLSHDFFRNDFLEVVNFLKSLTLKSEEEKTEFFKFLLDRVSCLSEELIASRLVPLLLNQLVFAEPVAVKSFLPHLLGPKKDSARGDTPCLLSPALFQSRVIPVLLQLFEVHEEHVRLVLLSHLEAYVEHFTQEQLKKIILPQVLLGLRDTSDSIVAITLHSLAVLVSLLGPEVVVGGERTKIFKRTAPGFTKTVDLSPEDSPLHVVCSQQTQMAPVVEKPSSGTFPKCFFSGSMPVSKKHIQQDCYNTLLQTGDQFPQPIKFPMNGLSDVKNTSGDSENCPPSSKKSEEWPDWSEPEEPENKAVSIQICPTEAYDASTSPLTNVNAEEVVWDDFESSSLDTEISARGGVSAVSQGTSGEQEAISTLVSLTEESKPLKLSLPQKTNLAQSEDDPDQTKPPKVSSQERRLKAPSELGLGEEFTIQVKKKPVQDPELDWFADMIPEIKPSAAILILPELRTEMMVSDKDDVSPVMQFSSKFAAAEMTEGESEGWGDEGELNWEDNNW
ncbi:protein-associating with the carboxyl-terminal domain of ezrin isoform X1 [Halichoerus grypus]|uniref:protein-associating with the carboxyl-terminal domain of ezrin isoform X1 n=2 Tax=Halichoerus grypus TaxID=9711 RepID=UPI00165979ED|nr:protein-associating with the carboxyl-terminal domain of ezrin isoform X1 [Halichoerus grypus]XP_035953864.1 protein-associating with the carboxyl-terminal domain of ezrin isoform X1 [Halichoerus grypus]XP_035953865.1 protein-associating with the carboxyl-terminal domain of ezrin isoform X1 [Halichoerus grypus]